MLVGAIRWTGQNSGYIGGLENTLLSPSAYHDRLPQYAHVLGANSITMDCGTQAIRDYEIHAAYRGGLDYFAYLLYGTEANFLASGKGNNLGYVGGLNQVSIVGQNDGLKYHLTSSVATTVKWCFIIQGFRIGWSEVNDGPTASRATFQAAGLSADWDSFADALVAKMLLSSYQKVSGNRPLLYWHTVSQFLNVFASDAAALTAMNLLRTKCTDAGLGTPYMVSMDSSAATTAKATAVSLGIDAIGDYALYGADTPNVEAPYANLTSAASAVWTAKAAVGGIDVVPLAMAGWDGNPRITNVVYPAVDYTQTPWYTAATASQFSTHALAAWTFCEANPTACPKATFLIYAWDEYSEGGYIAPLLGSFESQRLTSLSGAIGRDGRRSDAAMTCSITFYDKFNVHKSDGTLDLNSNTFKVTLHTSTYVPNRATDEVFADATNELSTANGYTAGGIDATIAAGGSFTRSGQTVKFDLNDVSWTASGGSLTARYAVVRAVGSLGGLTDPLVCYVTLDSSDVVVSNGNTLPITWPAAGLLTETLP